MKRVQATGPKGGPIGTVNESRLARLVPRWLKRYRKVTLRTVGNPAPINPAHPHAPASHPLTKHEQAKKHPAGRAGAVVAYCHASLAYAGKMTYSEGADRSQLFHRKPGGFSGAHADCSQYVASILHWLGVKTVTDSDYTGSLLEKGKLLKAPRPGCVAIWGPGTGAHAAFVTVKVGSDWMTVGFGHQGAPDRNTLSGMNAYFESVNEPGVRFLEFTT